VVEIIIYSIIICHLFLTELSKAQRSFANVLKEFRLECIGEIDTDDEMEIGKCKMMYCKIA
jgi:hypothetical protein